jgi:hypothetical protein
LQKERRLLKGRTVAKGKGGGLDAFSFNNRPILTATLSFCHPDRSEPGFPATQRETKPRMRLSLKERRMKSANAIKTYRKSGVAEGRDLQSFPPK